MSLLRVTAATGAALVVLNGLGARVTFTEVPPHAIPTVVQAARRGVTATDSSDVAGVVSRYHTALATGDSAAALALLAPDAVVLESGAIETRDEYRSHHLAADIEFARGVPSRRSPIAVRVRGDVAWASSTSTAQGQFRGRAVNSSAAELMVLSREGGGWVIRAIHWSSRTRRPPGG